MKKMGNEIRHGDIEYAPYFKTINGKNKIIYVPYVIEDSVVQIPFFEVIIAKTSVDCEAEQYMSREEFNKYTRIMDKGTIPDFPDFNSKDIYYDRNLGKKR